MRNISILILSTLLIYSCVSEMVDDPIPRSEDNCAKEGIQTRSSGDSLCYYWYQDEKVYLPLVEDKYFAVFSATALANVPMISSLNSGVEFNEYKYHTTSEKGLDGDGTFLWAEVDAEMARAYSGEIVYLAPYLKGATKDLGVTDRFYVKLKSAKDYDLLEEFAVVNGAKIVNENFLPLWYALVCTDLATENALTLSNKAYESGLFDKTDINLIGNFSWDSVGQPYSDTYYPDQWNLYDTYGIDIEKIHSITYGSGAVMLAVIDSGFRLNHPDLPIHYSWNAVTGTSPAGLYKNSSGVVHSHGTEMAGIIGATPNNQIGIVGIAPGLTLLPISIGVDINVLEYVEAAIRYAADSGAKVISNSYSYASPQDKINAAFEYALNKGCVIVQSSGNDDHNLNRYPYSSLPEVISVGNIQRDGTRWTVPGTSDGSTYGTYLDVVAPGTDIKTTTVGTEGDYKFCIGTSPACPHVAATVGLILSVNPSLTRTQVTDIIESTARKLPYYVFSTYQARPNGTWNSEVGYGLINPVAALRLAKGYYNLIEFDYSGQSISFTVNADKDIAVIWDWDTEDITELSVTSPVEHTFSHTFSTSGTRRIYIAEKVDFSTSAVPTSSSAITKFDFITGTYASNIDIKPINSALEYVRIIGGENFASQDVEISDLPNLEDLYLVRLKGADVVVSDCPSLKRFGTSTHIPVIPSWRPTPINPIPIEPIVGGETFNPDVVGGEGAGTPTDSWPDVPEAVVSPRSLDISGCNSITTLSLENVGFISFSFAEFNNLQLVYLSSQHTKIVGASDNASSYNANGGNLAAAVSSLPHKIWHNDRGMIIIRAVNSTNTAFVPVSIALGNVTSITNTCASKNWELDWDTIN